LELPVAAVTATQGLLAAMVVGGAAQVVAPRAVTGLLCKSNPGLARGQLWRLVTPVLVHGGIGHLAVNAMSLSNVGPAVEAWFGPARLLGVFTAGAAGASAASWRASRLPSVGASGAVFGLLGAWAVFLAENKSLLGRAQAEQGLRAVARTVGTSALLGFTMPQVDHAAHVGGLVAGAAAAWAVGPRLRREARGPWEAVALVDDARAFAWADGARETWRRWRRAQRRAVLGR
jgi:uridine nucleosidase